MLTVAVAGLKGGVGKSTIATNLAVAFHKEGHRVVLVDSDPQGTCQDWAAVADEDGPLVVGIQGQSLRRDVARVAEGRDVAIIDCPARLGDATRQAMVAADIVLLPTLPGAADVWALQKSLAVFQEARAYRPELPGRVVLNRTSRTKLTRLARSAVEELEGVELLPVALGRRVAFGEALLAGQGVVDYAPRSAAADEVRALMGAVIEVLGG